MHMVTAGALTKRTHHHVEIRYFALLQWAEAGSIKAEPVPTAYNISDSLTKATGQLKFHQHADVYMGRTPPSYVSSPSPHSIVMIMCMQQPHNHPPPFHMYDMQEVSALRFPVLHHALSGFTRESTEHGGCERATVAIGTVPLF